MHAGRTISIWWTVMDGGQELFEPDGGDEIVLIVRDLACGVLEESTAGCTSVYVPYELGGR